MYKQPDIESSYQKNDLGFTIYSVVRMLKPKVVVDFGILSGYSTICIAQAIRDNGEGKVLAYDIFDEYEYKSSDLDILEKNLIKYNVKDYVQIHNQDFYKWVDNPPEFDLLHLDISNTGSIIQLAYDKLPNKHIIFEGGSEERDEEEWVSKYNKSKICPLKSSLNYKILNKKWPSLSIMQRKDDDKTE